MISVILFVILGNTISIWEYQYIVVVIVVVVVVVAREDKIKP